MLKFNTLTLKKKKGKKKELVQWFVFSQTVLVSDSARYLRIQSSLGSIHT